MTEGAALKLQEFETRMRAYSMLGLLLAWKVFDPIFDPIFTMALKALYPGSNYS